MPNARVEALESRSIRRLLPTDLDRVVEIDREISGQPRRGFFVNRLAASRNEPGGFISLAYVENGVVEGHALAHMLDGEFGLRRRVAVLDAIGTSKSVRGHGGARAMIKELQLAARSSGAHALRTQALWSDESMMHFLAAAGFRLGTRIVLDRACGKKPGEMRPRDADVDVSLYLTPDPISVRSMTLADLPSVIGLDRGITGQDRSVYLKRKVDEALRKNGVRLSMLAEIDETPAGFIMARVDYGEFGETEAEAVLDTIGVDSEFQRQNVATSLLAQLLSQLSSLRVERVRTVVEWNNTSLIAFLDRSGFKPTQNLSFALLL
ncbi:MAG TPA: GNAT family N-acetyltransferase [Bradyrhizobium sp.]|nr:GNAT family N-acetyltransferase [Bradyrhizobium sp.]